MCKGRVRPVRKTGKETGKNTGKKTGKETGKTKSLPVSLPVFLTGFLTGLLTGFPYRSDPAYCPNPYRFLTVPYLLRFASRKNARLWLMEAPTRRRVARGCAGQPASNGAASGTKKLNALPMLKMILIVTQSEKVIGPA